jgi:outer membrane immunogenic protein
MLAPIAGYPFVRENRMRRVFVAFAALVAASASSAKAADMAVKARPMAAAAEVYSWTGFYVGVSAGGAWSRANTASSTIFAPPADYFGSPINVAQFNLVGAQRDTANGFTGGGQAGYNWQAGNIVAGIETDFQYFHLAGGGSATGTLPTIPGTFMISQSFSTNWLWTFRPRVGLAANNWLFYATGGLALTNTKANWRFLDNFGDVETTSLSKTLVGWAVGGGAEYAFSGGWSLKAEYLYLNFGNAQITTSNILDSGFFPVPRQPIAHNISLTSNVVRIGLNYKLGGPVVAWCLPD